MNDMRIFEKEAIVNVDTNYTRDVDKIFWKGTLRVFLNKGSLIFITNRYKKKTSVKDVINKFINEHSLRLVEYSERFRPSFEMITKEFDPPRVSVPRIKYFKNKKAKIFLPDNIIN